METLNAQLHAAGTGYRLTLELTLTGDETAAEIAQMVSEQNAVCEQARLIVSTLQLVGFDCGDGALLMSRNGTGSWRRPELPRPSPPPPESDVSHGFAVEHIKSFLAEAEADIAPDPVLRAVMNGVNPQVNRQMSAALTRALPESERVPLVRALGGSAEQIYDFLVQEYEKDPKSLFTVGEVSKATGLTTHSCGGRLADLESAALVARGHKQLSGKHKRWVAYRALIQEPALSH